jgi:predicted nucleic acid-binding Zn ribbon protein
LSEPTDDDQVPPQPDDAPEPEEEALPDLEKHEPTGLELARSIARGLAGRTGQRTTRPGTRWHKRRDTVSSSAHPDDRDPQTLDTALGRFVGEQGWETELRVHGVFSRWDAIVGREVAQHATPESYADGRLVVRTDSTAWATQMKLLAPDVVRRLNEVLGDETVRVIDVAGPRAPSWTKGRLRVKGRGPRDTYG